ncbi:MAG TPA: metal-dependent hydrolase [Ferruginibacter sp.]|nr:metal-dependent hydrolase [Ferruginibacter sp.]
MDSLTHIALGACMGEAFAGKKVGKKAMLWGILAQSIPDIDFVTAFWMNTPGNLLAHRGFTHSILFMLIMAVFLALIAEKWHRPHNISFRRWLFFFAAVISGHIFIDAFNNYGVGWFEPFSHMRISFNSIYVADPFFSIWSAIACIALLVLGRRSHSRKTWWRFGLIMSALYLGYCSVNKWKIDSDVNRILHKQAIVHSRYFTTPAPLQNWLWFVVAGNDEGYYVGFRSLFDSQKKIDFQYFPRNDSLLKPILGNEDLLKLIRFSKQFYTVEKYGDSLVFNDLRFGQIIGWKDPTEKFAFHYFLDYPNDNKLVVQRGRFARWDWQVAKSLMKRAAGN